ncbi:MAG: DUF4878 domain-containing protein [Bacteroidia bacterium]|nr:DUF4878 domain-containing protein [Bacteroidia bacterium]
MKFKFCSAFFLALILAITACTQSDSPKAIAEKFLHAMNSYDFDEARKYGTEDTGKLLDIMSGFAKMVPDSSRTSPKFEITGEKIVGDKATVMYREEGRNTDIPMTLVRVDGKWKVAMSKETMNESEGGDSMNIGATTDGKEDHTPAETTAPDSLK